MELFGITTVLGGWGGGGRVVLGSLGILGGSSTTCDAGTRLATSVRHVRRDQREPDPTESDTAPAGSY